MTEGPLCCLHVHVVVVLVVVAFAVALVVAVIVFVVLGRRRRPLSFGVPGRARRDAVSVTKHPGRSVGRSDG